MGTGLQGEPNNYTFGYEFDYALWTPGSEVKLLNVAWDNNYRDIVRFQNRTDLNAYIDSQPGKLLELMSYLKPFEPIKIGLPHSVASQYNYLRARNPLQPIQGGDVAKDYYYFILGHNYIAPGTVELVLQLDVVQTYLYDVSFGNCYVERGHIGIANENGFNNYGRDYLTIPEGLDIGGEYLERMRRIIETFNLGNADVLAISTVDLRADAGTEASPILVSAPGGQMQRMVSGASAYVWRTQEDFQHWMIAMQNKPWVTQGVISITLIPDSARYHPSFVYDATDTWKPSTAPVGPAEDVRHELTANWRNELTNLIPERYRHLKKLLTYPYTIIEIGTNTGSPVILKPESWGNDQGRIGERVSLVPPNQRIAYIPLDYNTATPGDPEAHFEQDGDYLALAVYIANFPTMPIVNDGAINYLASNSNSLAWQKANAEWTQNRALGSASAQYDIATSAMHTQMDLSGIGVNADIGQTANQNRTLAAQAIVNSINSGVGGVGTALTPGGFGGAAITGVANAATGAINAGIQTAANDEALGIRNNQAGQTVVAQNRQGQMVRDTNKGLADWAAKGDYANAIAGVDAKVQDAAMIQPSTSGQNGGETFNLINQVSNFLARWKTLDNAAMRRVGDYWLRYGYAIHNFMTMPSNLMVMSKFTYWKLTETYLVAGPIPEGYKQAIRGIFEKGVTVWVNPNDIGQIDLADNEPLEGITY